MREMLGRLKYSISIKRRPRTALGLLRMWWHDFVVHPIVGGTEICEDCGMDYPLWVAADRLWSECMGGSWGLLCPSCFSKRMDGQGVTVQLLAVPYDKSDPSKWRHRINDVGVKP